MSLPVRSTDVTGAVAADTPSVVKVRLMGPPTAVAEIARRLRAALRVMEESRDYPRRRDLGVRRYLAVMPAEEASR